MEKKLLDYFNGDELAASTWLNKYAAEGETTPDDMHRRMAKEFAKIESKYELAQPVDGINPMGNKKLTEDDIYGLLKDFKYVIPGGSVMSVLGTNQNALISNCTVLPPPNDSMSSILNSARDMANLFKRRAGVGLDLSNLRPAGAHVNNSAKSSTGPVSFMDLYSTVVNTVSQKGRRGALMLSLSVSHPDVLEFIEKKQDLTKVTGANISVRVNDEFMKAVENNEDYILRYPVNQDLSYFSKDYLDVEYNKLVYLEDHKHDNKVFYIRKIRAKELWDKLCECAWKTAEPGVLFWDNIMNTSPDGKYPGLKPVGTNPCQPASATLLTRNGIKTMGEIKVGDRIWSSEGWTEVINKWSTGVKDVYEYTTARGVFLGTENHRLMSNGVKTEAKDCRFIDSLIGEYKERDFEFSPEDVIDGLNFADGGVYIDGVDKSVLLNVKHDDYEIFNSEFKDLIIEEISSANCISSHVFMVQTTISSDDIDSQENMRIPERFMHGNRRTVCSFLRGLFSSSKISTCVGSIYSGYSYILAYQIQTLLSSLGIRSQVSDMLDNEGNSKKRFYTVTIISDLNKFVNLIGFVQEYKKNDFLNPKIDNYIHGDAVINKKYIGKEEVFDITVDNTSHTYWTGGLNVSNCGEQPLAAYDSCRLMHINLTSFVENPFTENATVNYDKLYDICYNAMRLADDLVDIESNCLQRIALNDFREEGNDSDEGQLLMKFDNTAGYGRRTGLGFTGLADMVAMMNLKMTDAESENLIDKVMSTMFQAELESSIDMAAIRERFPAYDEEYENKAWCDFVKEINPALYDKMKMFGRRNISFSTCAPTGTVSLLARCSSGIEPVFMPYYTRRRKIQSDDEKVDFVDITGQKYTEFQVVHPGLLKFMEMKGYTDAKEAYEASPYYKSTAMDIPYNKRVTIQSTVQKYITSAISSTVNLPTETTVKVIDELYHLSNELNLKGITVYRDGSREGVLNKTPKPLELPKTGAPKRPKTLEADFYPIKVKGERFAVIVGLFDNRPYEVFTYKLDPSVNNVSEHRGVITKKKKMHYSFDSDYIHVDNLNADEVEERAATLYSSMLLRHGVDVKYIIKTAKKVNDNIISFSSAMCRVLSKYLESGDSGEKCPECGSNLIRTAGCLSCPNCGYSKCM